METSKLRELWSKSLGPGIELDSLPTHVTYKPIGLDSELLEESEHPVVTESGGWKSIDPVEEIGRGGMGIVYRARQASLKREVALKTLRRRKRRQSSTPAARSGFLAEAYTTGRLAHPNIVPIYELGETAAGELFLAMKLVGGTSWLEMLRADQPPPLPEQLEILLQVCNAVAFAHSRGIVHNDLKPANVMIGEFGEVLVMDWGLAVSFVRPPADSGLRYRTCVKDPCGTPSYMAPELAEGRGEDIGPWTDVYLLGAILYRLLCGRPPHKGSDFIQVIIAAALSRPAVFEEEVPEALQRICRKAMAADPDARYPDVQSFQAELRDFLRHRESMEISTTAQKRLAACKTQAACVGALDRRARSQLYDGFTRAMAGFEQARQLWPENPAALSGERDARLDYARTALLCADLGLAESQAAALDEHSQELTELRQAIEQARRRQQRERAAARRLRWALAVAVVLIIGGLSGGLLLVNSQKAEIATKSSALAQQKRLAETRQDIAVEALEQMTYHLQTELRNRRGEREFREMAERFLSIAQQGWSKLGAADLQESRVSFGGIGTLQRLGDLKLELELEPRAALETFEHGITRARELLAGVPDSLQLRGRRVLARLLLGAGDAHKSLNQLQAAEGCYFEAQELTDSLPTEEIYDLGLQVDVAIRLGQLRMRQGQLDKAERHLEQSLFLRQRIISLRPDDISHRWNLTVSQVRLAELLSERGRNVEALRLMEDCLARRRSLRETSPWSSTLDLGLAAVLRMLGNEHYAMGRFPEAMAAYSEALELRRTLLARDPESSKARFNLAVALGNVADMVFLEPDLERSLSLCQEAWGLLHELVGLGPVSFELETEINLNRDRLGDICLAEGDPEGAQVFFLACLESRRKLFAPDPSNSRALRDLYISESRMARCCLARNDPSGAREMAEAALEHLCDLYARDPDNARVGSDLQHLIDQLGKVFTAVGVEDPELHAVQVGEAAARRVAERDASAGSRQALGAWLLRLFDLHRHRGAEASALPLIVEANAIHRELATAQPGKDKLWRFLAAGLTEQANLHARVDQMSQAEALFREALGIVKRLESRATPVEGLQGTQANIEIELGMLALQRQDLGSAASSIEQGLTRWRQIVSEDPAGIPELIVHLRRIGLGYYNDERFDTAYGYLAEAAGLAARAMGPEPAARRARVRCLFRLIAALRALDRLDEGLACAEEARELAQGLIEESQTLGIDAQLLALVVFEQGECLVAQGKPAEGLNEMERAYEIYQQLAASDSQIADQLPVFVGRIQRLRAQALLDGNFEASTGPEHAALARALFEVGRHYEACLHYDQAFNDPETWFLQDFMRACKASALALAAPDCPQPARIEALALAWLEAVVVELRDDIQRARQDPGQAERLAPLRNMWEHYRVGSDYESLHALPEFQRIFEPDPWQD